MLNKFYNKKGQILAGEYIIVLALAAAAITTMGVYFRRGVQARIRDANVGMIDIVRERTADTYAGTDLWRQYEPYYLDSELTTTRSTSKTTDLIETFGNSSGITRTGYNDRIYRQTTSETLPPMQAD